MIQPPPATGPAPDRRSVLCGALSFAAALPLGIPASSAASPSGDTLASLAAAKGLHLGGSFAVHETDAPHGAAYAALYAREVQGLTSELELKLSVIRAAADTEDFWPADRLFAFAESRGMGVRGHTLVWNDDVPAWIKALSAREAGALMDRHIERVLQRYRGRAWAWDVVNEPIAPWDKRPGNLRDGPFLAAFGESYIARSFAIARRLEPTARLVLNEAFTETADARGATYRDSLLALVRRLKDQGAPIDAIGLQCHLSSRYRYDFPRFAAFVADLASLGLDIHLTELDVDDSAFPRPTKARDARVAALYRDFLAAVLPIRAVTSLTLWQLADHTSWLGYRDAEQRPAAADRPRPLPFDHRFERKPAWTAIADALRAMPPR
jgi:endo-1,4-beta-xylanase